MDFFDLDEFGLPKFEETSEEQKEIDFLYKQIMDMIIETDIKKIILEMISNHEQRNVFYDKSQDVDILMHYLSNYEEVLSLANCIAEKNEIAWRNYLDNTSELIFEKFEHYDDNVKRQNISKRINDINIYILNKIQSKAEKELQLRAEQKRLKWVHLREKKGAIINFKECREVLSFYGHYEFYKDDGWGIANEDGIVEIPNYILIQPSKIGDCLSFNKSLMVVQCGINYNYGIISLLSLDVVLPFEYDVIEEFGNWYERPKCSLVKVKNRKGWGCVDEKGNVLIECKYYKIELICEYLECYKDDSYVQNESLSSSSRTVYYTGRYDLYDNKGNFLIGGYTRREHYLNDVYYYYFESFYEDYYEKELDWMNNEIEMLKYRINYDKSVCLILDKHLKSVIRRDGEVFQFPIGKSIDSINELYTLVPADYLYHHEVNLWSGHFIFQKERLGEKKIVQETKTIKTYHPHMRPATKEEKEWALLLDETVIEEVKEDYVYSEVTEDVLKEDDRVVITGLSKENDILWSSCVNELGKLNGCRLPAYRKGITVGFYSEDGLEDASFVAITYKDGKYYVAKLEFEKELENSSKNNLNYLGEIPYTEKNEDIFKDGRHMYIRYYEYSNGHLTRMSDDWKVFNPAKHDWFPETYKTTYHIYNNEDDQDYSDYGREREYEWTDEDAWDAMTDGMYGDYPGSGWDNEWFGY